MQLNVPDEVIQEQLIKQFISLATIEFEKRLALMTKTLELSPYPNRAEVKKVLRIGDEKLDSWIDRGLKIQPWSEKDIRIERGELQRFLKINFET